MDLMRLRIGATIEMLSIFIKLRYIHLYLTGQTGTGKSALIANMWKQDCMFNYAKVLIDPSGFLAKDCSILAKNAVEISLDEPNSLNPMADESLDDNTIVDIIWESINHIVQMTTNNEQMTVRMHSWLSDAIFDCLDRERRSLEAVFDHMQNMRGNDTAKEGVLYRIKMLLNDERMRKIICGPQAINWNKLINQKVTLVINCKGMSQDKMIFIGNLVTQGIKNYFRFSKSDFKNPLALYIDECHNFISPNFFDILKEGRKYKIGAVLASQDLALIDRKLADVMLNVGNIISFKNGWKEAMGIARELNMKPEEIQFIDKFHFAYKTPDEVGIGKASRPPVIPKVKKRPVELQPKSKWFTLKSYQPA